MDDDFTNLLNWVADTATSLTRAFDECATMIPNDLFTAMRFHPESMEVERLFSTLPDIYPISGRKPKRQTEWGENVLIQQQINLECGPEAIAWAFSDHKRLCCTKRVRDSCRESNVVAGPQEQTDIADLQNQELG
jgi:hypothetical protein